MNYTDDIKLSNLNLDLNNFRFSSVRTQREAYSKMLSTKKAGLESLASDIIEKGLNPGELLHVTPLENDSDQYIVLEGNRRTLCLKLLDNPESIDDPAFSKIKKKFVELSKEFNKNPIRMVKCVVHPDPKEALHWLKVKHSGELGGVGTVKWGSLEKLRFDSTIQGKNPPLLQILSFCQESESVSDEEKELIENLPNVTNFKRLVEDSHFKEIFGINISRNTVTTTTKPDFLAKALVKVAEEVKKVNVKEIYSHNQRVSFIDDVLPDSIKPKKEDKVKGKYKLSDFGNVDFGVEPEPVPSNPPPKPKVPRTKLIPTGYKLRIDQHRINGIFSELSKLKIDGHKNAISVLFRVFIELSVDYYRDEIGLSPNGPSGDDANLPGKINVVIKSLADKRLLPPAHAKAMKKQLASSTSVLSVANWHGFVHNYRIAPSADDLIEMWDGVQEFVTKLWQHINDQK
ncbi:MAG: hypothetical protein KDC34_19175 [Saprospiraceae bacterium]|nr:hypothetical protein [Saprospiraceae bacterium]